MALNHRTSNRDKLRSNIMSVHNILEKKDTEKRRVHKFRERKI
jgi:hypothetical protein